jgi:hypothetical protein
MKVPIDSRLNTGLFEANRENERDGGGECCRVVYETNSQIVLLPEWRVTYN